MVHLEAEENGKKPLTEEAKTVTILHKWPKILLSPNLESFRHTPMQSQVGH